MKNPLIILAGVVITSIAIPICISVLAYDSNNQLYTNTSKEIKLKHKPNKKIINYETVNKETPQIKVYNHKKGQIENKKLEEYLYGVISGEMSAEFDLEALKAQAVAARTFAIYNQNSKKHKDADICTDYKHCQEYKSKDELLKKNGKKWMDKYYTKIEQAVNDTKGHIIVYNDEPILPLYFSTSSGSTENSEEVFSTKYPYLRSVDSPYDKNAPKYASNIKINNEDFVKAIKSNYPTIDISSENLSNQIKVKSRSKGGSVEKIKISNKELTGRDIRNLFSLNSANFELKFNKNYVDIIIKGYGHGVGMSQWGAEGMAKDGYEYYEILNHYYSDTKIKDIY